MMHLPSLCPCQHCVVIAQDIESSFAMAECTLIVCGSMALEQVTDEHERCAAGRGGFTCAGAEGADREDVGAFVRQDGVLR